MRWVTIDWSIAQGPDLGKLAKLLGVRVKVLQETGKGSVATMLNPPNPPFPKGGQNNPPFAKGDLGGFLAPTKVTRKNLTHTPFTSPATPDI